MTDKPNPLKAMLDEVEGHTFAHAPKVRAEGNGLHAALDVVAALLDEFGGYSGVPACDAAITLMQKHGVDRWSMQSQMGRSAINARLPARDGTEVTGAGLVSNLPLS